MMVVDHSLACSQQSLAIGETIAGSAAAEVGAWLCLEVRERWEADVADQPLPENLRRAIAAAAPHRLRVQLIRSWNASETLQAFLVRTAPSPRLWRFRYQDPRELGEIDFSELLASGAAAGEPDPPREIYLVCTHGRRDRCCALRGVAFYKSLIDLEPELELWQTSHLGGHRFAATMVYLPRGISYGRLVPEDAEAMVTAHAAGRLYDLRRYRGQTRFASPVQAAEAWLREQEGDMRLDGPRLVGHEGDPSLHRVRFDTRDGNLHQLTLVPRRGSVLRKASCDASELSAASFFQVTRHEAVMVAR